MTVIAWDGKTLAADRQSTCGEIRLIKTKLRRLDNGLVAATAGDSDSGLVLLEWLENGSDPDKWPAFQNTADWVILIVWKNGKVYAYNQRCVPMLVEDPYMAWGSGSAFALGALAMGATAAQAVEAANKHCTSCGFGFDSVEP